jgi:flagellar biosynthesis GTPase FlhF
MRKNLLKAVSILSVALAVALFIPQRAAADDDDPPSRVARLGFARGSVSFNPAGTDDWVSAVVNRPVTTGDKIWNDADGRSELSIGSAVIRLGSTTGFSFLNLTDNTAQIRVTEGTLNIRVRSLGDDETFEVDTPNLAFTVLRPGNYKIVVNEAGDTTTVVVRDGQGEVTGGGSAYTIHPNEIGAFVGTDQLDADVESWESNDDDFDGWCADRDRRIDHSVSARYVSTDAIGYEDLDEYGGWRPVPEYGTIWFPHTAIVGWAPYHYGHWAYIAPWGYTWVDDAPWGFAPFHYGRWVTVGGVWGWVPCAPRPVAVVGVAYVRPVYAPALVAWVGGPHFAVGIGVGGGFAAGVNVGWFPLGPREVYVPSYPVSRTYVNNVNISNTTVNTTVVNNYYNTTVVNKNVTVTNVKYVNQSVPGAVTATTPQAFTSAQSVSKNSVVVNEREVASAPVAATTPPVAPAKQAVLGSGTTAAAKPPAALANRPVVAKTAPPPPPASFAKQQQAIQANGGKPLAVSQIRQIQPEPAQTRAAVKIAPPSKPATPRNLQANRPGAPNNPAQPAPGSKPATAPANPGSQNANQKSYSDRPPVARPSNANVNGSSSAANAANAANAQLEQKHQQQLEQLRAQQDQERQKVEQQQVQERQKAQQEADAAKQQKLNQQHQQQLEQLEQKHAQEEQQLKQKQQQEAQKAKPAKNPPKEKDDKTKPKP